MTAVFIGKRIFAFWWSRVSEVDTSLLIGLYEGRYGGGVTGFQAVLSFD